jgi:hypothetical protein
LLLRKRNRNSSHDLKSKIFEFGVSLRDLDEIYKTKQMLYLFESYEKTKRSTIVAIEETKAKLSVLNDTLKQKELYLC